MATTKEAVTIKVPRVPDFIRKEKKEVLDKTSQTIFNTLLKVKTHIEEAKRLLATNFRKPHGQHLVRYLGASYDDFRKEIWVVSVLLTNMRYAKMPLCSLCSLCVLLTKIAVEYAKMPLLRSENTWTEPIWRL